MGLLFVETLPGPKVFKCKLCKVDSASQDEIVSKDFQGRYGRAYLFEKVVNVCLGPNEDRHLLSGLHTVNDVHCSSCQQILGWRYLLEEKNFYAAHRTKKKEKAYEESQKYKEGKYILEKAKVMKVG
ncbi:putative yippee-like protein Os10g0369500 isoform X1 [Dendrobium catenatum]|uniref:putative yippee-like protein Os10g0369500 isoform X1 n=1 Tax=Dendrobium catenatum TaxID=906689 RepID=UPI0010A09636|nr:putative yippee-like protein Os10g0369500 isoform X1 [Dendrobium catenatum]